MKRFLGRVLVVLLLSLWARATSGQEIKVEFKPRLQPLSYQITQQGWSRSQRERDRHVKTLAVLREEKVTEGKDGLLVSEESLSYLDEQGKIIEKPTERTGVIATVAKRDTRGNAYPKRRKHEQAPLIWPTLCSPRVLPVLPAGITKVGETWTETVPVHSWLHTFDVVVESKLESIEDHLGYRCAKVSYEFYGHWNVREQPDARKGAIDSMRFGTEEIVGSGVLYFGYEVGAIVQKEQELKYVVDEHTKHWDKEGQIAMTVDNYAELEFRLQMKLEE